MSNADRLLHRDLFGVMKHSGGSGMNAHSRKSSPRRGKLTIVGFFSSTKAFLVNRLKCKMMYGGRRVHLYRRS
jgi:hypothetical protein